MYNSSQLGKLSDRDLLAESRAYEAALTADAASLNFTNVQADAIKNANNAFEATLDAWDAIQLEEAGLSESKKTGRKDVLDELRGQRNTIYADTSIASSTIANYGIPPRDDTKTPSPAPSTAPLGWVDYGKLKHTIHFRNSATPDKKAKPAGMLGCEIWRFIGTAAPVSESDFHYVATDTDSPYVSMFPMADGGKTAFYILRWLSKSGERGEWSETIEATINS